ncbi:MAG: porin [Paludisphaera borealis]|uniref:porin n=1 Tax=Paludisphaera borealis TaxID=1387353 RepID=UPI002851E092|nr:porin [Paludisphaera borealis]MDR3618847.1 porin [Paludisphaera borealis]
MARRRRPIRDMLVVLAVVSAFEVRAQQPSDAEASPASEPQGEVLDDRLRKLEAMNRAIVERLDRSERERLRSEDRYRSLESRYEDLLKRLDAKPDAEADALPDPLPPRPAFREPGRQPDDDRPRGLAEHARGGAFADRLLIGAFGEGFGLKTEDDEYQLRFRVLDQTDFKVFSPGNQIPASSGIYIPRVRVYFEGQLTRLFQYEVSIQRSVEGVWDLLDGNVDVNIDPRFKVKFGRTLVPYSYDWYDHLEQYFITPERSLFPLNFGLSRSAGLMAHGRLFEDRVQYAVGGFDGHLVGVADNNSTRDAVSYLNARPFAQSERWPWLRNLNLGVSGYLGQQVRPQKPLPMRTSLQSSENDEAAQQATSLFLAFNEDVYLLGGHSALAAHVAWYVGGLSFEAEWQGGRDHYARAGSFQPVSVPVSGNHITASYFVTGEKVTDRSRVDPLRPFDPLRNGWGPGAFEPFARYSGLRLGETVFKSGLSDPNVWTNSIGMTDIGLNWYPTSFIKIYFDWQHAMYGSPVMLNKDLRSNVNDLFWIRGQLYY